MIQKLSRDSKAITSLENGKSLDFMEFNSRSGGGAFRVDLDLFDVADDETDGVESIRADRSGTDIISASASGYILLCQVRKTSRL